MTAMRLMRAVAAGVYEVQKFIPRLWRMGKELFHEVTGFVFLALTAFFIFGRQGLIRTYQTLDTDPDGPARLVLVSVFVLMFGAFGISSFRRAKRVSREK